MVLDDCTLGSSQSRPACLLASGKLVAAAASWDKVRCGQKVEIIRQTDSCKFPATVGDCNFVSTSLSLVFLKVNFPTKTFSENLNIYGVIFTLLCHGANVALKLQRHTGTGRTVGPMLVTMMVLNYFLLEYLILLQTMNKTDNKARKTAKHNEQ